MKTYGQRLQDMFLVQHESKRKFQNMTNLEERQYRGSRLLGGYDKRMKLLVLPLEERLNSRVLFRQNPNSPYGGKFAFPSKLFSESHFPHSLEGTKETLHSSQILQTPQILAVRGQMDPPKDNARVSDCVTTRMSTDAAKTPVATHGSSFNRSNFDLTRENELETYRREVKAVEANRAIYSTRSKGRGSNLQEGPTFSGGSGNQTREASRVSVWKELYARAQRRDPRVGVDSKAKDVEAQFSELQLTRKVVWGRAQRKDVADAFTALSVDAEKAVDAALYSSERNRILVTHDKTNIDITGAVLQCLMPGAWLNDEVINLYMQLLKEREELEPKKFLKCHFFNTFFYNKLFKDKGSYDYKAVRRWTLEKKLGYSLLDCEKILVPIHKDIHWCLAVINIRDKKIEYLDSLNGMDDNVLQVLAKYIVDEAKDKKGESLDVASWEHVYRHDIPEQHNGCDCGMFMVKYADFHSRGVAFSFTQSDMEYFRRRTTWEILNLRAS